MSEIEIKNLSVGYDKKTILDDISFSLNKGEVTVLLGLNGSGKTTLLKSIAGLLKPFKGSIIVKGKEISSLSSKEKAKNISYIAQRPSSPEGLTLLDIVLMGYNSSLSLLSRVGKKEEEEAKSVIKSLFLEEKTNELFSSLSEGQKQLGILARALVQSSPIMLMDEPESALDYKNRIMLLKTIRKIAKEMDKTVLLTMHSPEYAIRYADRIVTMKDKKIKRSIYLKGEKCEKIEEVLREIYGDIRLFKCGKSSYTIINESDI